MPFSFFIKNQFKLVLKESVVAKELLLTVSPVLGRWEKGIHTNPTFMGEIPESLFNHVGYDPLQERTAQFETGVGVNFYEPRVKVLVKHKIQSK